jgi:hypothetical protein
MATNNYIFIDSYKYVVLRDGWKQLSTRPRTIRFDITGNVDVVQAAYSTRSWQVSLRVDDVPDLGFGTMSTLMDSFEQGPPSLLITPDQEVFVTVRFATDLAWSNITPMLDGVHAYYIATFTLIETRE